MFVCIQRDWSSIKAFDLVGQNGKDKKRDGGGKKERKNEREKAFVRPLRSLELSGSTGGLFFPPIYRKRL